EAVVFGARVAADINGSELAAPQSTLVSSAVPQENAAPSPRLRELMSKQVGVVRTGDGLAQALSAIADMETQAASVPPPHIATGALMIAAAAYARHESRGAHFRLDFPTADPKLAHRTMMTLPQAREIAEQAAPVRRLAADAY